MRLISLLEVCVKLSWTNYPLIPPTPSPFDLITCLKPFTPSIGIRNESKGIAAFGQDHRLMKAYYLHPALLEKHRRRKASNF